MPVARSKSVAINKRREHVADLYLQGKTQMEISEVVGVKQPTVSQDLKKIQKQWRESAIRDFDLAREVEIQKIDRIEREAWAAWERSKQPSQSAITTDDTHDRKTRRHVKNQYGDPRFLEQVNKCIASRRALLGLDAPTRLEGNLMDLTLSSDEIALWASLLPYATEQELAELENYLVTLSPGSFAQIASRGRWTPAKHLAYLDQTIIDAIEQSSAEKLDGLIVSMPPQHGKSMLCSHYLPAWYLGKYPDRRVILTSYEADFAASWGRKARDLLEQHGHLFGVRVSRRSGAANRWDIEGREGGMTAAGVGGPITGKGAHLLIVDDPIKNDEEARSSTFREKQWQWWQSVATTRLRPGALMVVIQTRWHRDDLTGRILRQAEETGHRWRVVNFPALAEEHDILGRQPGEALWPEVFSRERLEQVKAAQTNYFWSALYQQNPHAEGSAEWPDDFFGPEIWFNDWPSRWDCKVVALDPSKGVESKFGDYSAFVMLMVSDGKLYVDADLVVRNTQVITDTAVQIQFDFRPDWFGVEVNQFQQLLANDLERRGRELGIWMPLCTIENYLNKIVRIRRLTPYLSRRQIRFKGDSQGARLLVEQLRDFPDGDHDDGPDALEMAVRLAGELFQERYHTPPLPTRIIAG